MGLSGNYGMHVAVTEVRGNLPGSATYTPINSHIDPLTLKVPEKLQLYGLYVYCVVHICDCGMLRVNRPVY